MNEIIENKLNIKDMIYEIRGKQVMLDSDLARLYGVETKKYRMERYFLKEKYMMLIV